MISGYNNLMFTKVEAVFYHHLYMFSIKIDDLFHWTTSILILLVFWYCKTKPSFKDGSWDVAVL
jgi:hypothetical protein